MIKIEQLVRGIVGLQQMYEEEKGVSCYDNVFDYISWLEEKLVTVVYNNDEKMKATQSTTKVDGDGC